MWTHFPCEMHPCLEVTHHHQLDKTEEGTKQASLTKKRNVPAINLYMHRAQETKDVAKNR